jgi:uncharacterized protein
VRSVQNPQTIRFPRSKIKGLSKSPPSIKNQHLINQSIINTMSTQRNIVGWFEIYVQDMERAKKFYEATFEVTLQHLPSPNGMPIEMWAFAMEPEMPGAPGALVKMDGCGPGGGGTIVYFSCDDCAVQAARAAANGGRIQQEKFSIGDYGFISLVFDTEDNLIGLHSMT